MRQGQVIDRNGGERWYKNGKLHRLDGPALTTIAGEKYWYKNGKLHRDDGPAVTREDGSCYWYQHGKLHRVDGPAIMTPQMDLYYLNGKKVDKEYFQMSSFVLHRHKVNS